MPRSHKIIYLLYVMFWVAMAIDPKYPADWLLENILVFLLFPFIVYMDRKYHYTSFSIILLLIFASMHSLGSHYTYAQMEHFDLITQLFGFERNHYDRVVHFSFGLLVFRILFEMINQKTSSLGTALFFTLTTVVTISTVYELLEWLVVIILHPELGSAFLGTQGDHWDAQKDTLVAIIGAVINMVFYGHYKTLLTQMNKKRQ
jgi:putative membrane protein